MIKIAENAGLDEFKKSGELKTFNMVFSDLDRYCSDKYELEITMRETKDDYSLSCVAFQSHIGVACFTRYWHYKKNELDEANKTFDSLKKISMATRDRFEYEKIPPVLLSNHLTFDFKNIDPSHREMCHVPHVNYSRKEDYGIDLRNNLYGGRYPGASISNYADREGVFNEQHKIIETEKTGRSKIVKYKKQF